MNNLPTSPLVFHAAYFAENKEINIAHQQQLKYNSDVDTWNAFVVAAIAITTYELSWVVCEYVRVCMYARVVIHANTKNVPMSAMVS